MANIHDKYKDDDVNGIIIGGECITGRLFYDGMPESQRFFCDSEPELIAECEKRLEKIKTECGSVFKEIFPDTKWIIRIDC